ncbi:MAG: pimeloyl-ACP methyl ester carboxylesterase [Verrucomicrobiales bacterium]|jgi:pimeloyl-ACP methyl ester carboxylesterase
MIKRFLFALSLFALSPIASAQDEEAESLAGTWAGEIKYGGMEFPVVFELKDAPGGLYTGQVRFPTEGDKGIPISAITVDGRKVTFVIKVADATYEGRLSSANRIRGEWKAKDGEADLDLKREEGGFAYKRPQNPREPFPYEVQEVEISNNLLGANHKLAGSLSKPERPVRAVPAVILISDAGPHDRDGAVASHRPFAVLSDFLTRQGIAVLRLDDRGTGKSTGYFESASTTDFTTDVLVALDFLREQKDVDPSKIGLIGHGEGAIVASLVAAQRDDVSFIVMLAGHGLQGDRTLLARSEALGTAAGLPADFIQTSQRISLEMFKVLKEGNVDLEKLAKLGQAFEQRMKTLNKNNVRDQGGAGDFVEVLGAQFNNLESIWLRAFVQLDPADSLKSVTCQVLALNGDRDLEVVADLHLAAIESALKAGGNERVVTRKLTGLNHLFQTADRGFPNKYSTIEETMSPVVLKGVSQWIGGVVVGN